MTEGNGRGVNWPLVVTLALAGAAGAGAFAVTTAEVSRMRQDMSAMEARLTAGIGQVDVNSANRRIEGHQEMLRLHEIQAQQIEDLRTDLREAKGLR